jgi:hypothetical protein
MTTIAREMRRLNRQPQMRTNRCLAHGLTALSAIALSLLPNSVSFALLTTSGTTSGPIIRLEDVDLFYAVYDAAGRRPSADQLQHDYLDRGSEGLHTFARIRNITGANLAAALSKNPEIYSEARRCAAALPQARERIYAAIRRLSSLYPDAKLPPITIAVGRGKPVAAAGPTDGLMVGLEALCRVKYFDVNVEDRFVHVIAHEYIHVQQPESIASDEHPTVLEASLMEGAAEFLGEMISGGVGNPGVHTEIKGRETEIETAFVADQGNTDLSKWLYNGTLDTPGDLGYWVGYRIVQSFYLHAADKRQAIRDILKMSDPTAFLARSGWHPGIRLG